MGAIKRTEEKSAGGYYPATDEWPAGFCGDSWEEVQYYAYCDNCGSFRLSKIVKKSIDNYITDTFQPRFFGLGIISGIIAMFTIVTLPCAVFFIVLALVMNASPPKRYIKCNKCEAAWAWDKLNWNSNPRKKRTPPRSLKPLR